MLDVEGKEENLAGEIDRLMRRMYMSLLILMPSYRLKENMDTAFVKVFFLLAIKTNMFF